MSYELFRGPDPRHYGRLRTWDAILREAYADNWFFDHYKLEAPTFVGVMPMRQDLQVEPLQDKVEFLGFRAWESVGMTIYWVRPRWWHPIWRLWRRLGRALGLIKPPPPSRIEDIAGMTPTNGEPS